MLPDRCQKETYLTASVTEDLYGWALCSSSRRVNTGAETRISFIRCILDLNYIGRRDGLIVPVNSTDKFVTTRRSIACPPVELRDGVNKEDQTSGT